MAAVGTPKRPAAAGGAGPPSGAGRPVTVVPVATPVLAVGRATDGTERPAPAALLPSAMAAVAANSAEPAVGARPAPPSA